MSSARVPPRQKRSEASDKAWDAAVEMLLELAEDEPDYERVEEVAMVAHGEARRACHNDRLVGDGDRDA